MVDAWKADTVLLPVKARLHVKPQDRKSYQFIIMLVRTSNENTKSKNILFLTFGHKFIEDEWVPITK